jgi:hypothetical protein
MTALLDLALEAHGGLDNWKGVTGVNLRLTLGGYLFEIKQHPHGLRAALVKVDARRPRTLIVPFPERGKRGIYQEGKVWVQTDTGAMVEDLPAPRTAYEGHQRSTPWNDLQYLYFIGYAFWNYFTTPFLPRIRGSDLRGGRTMGGEPSEMARLESNFRFLNRHSLRGDKTSTSTTMAWCSVTTTSPTSPKVTRPTTAWTIRPLTALSSQRVDAWFRVATASSPRQVVHRAS